MAEQAALHRAPVERHAAHPLAHVAPAPDAQGPPRARQVQDDVRLARNGQHVEIRLGDRHQPHRQEHVQRPHRARVVVPRRAVGWKRRPHPRGPFRRQVVPPREREQERRVERRLVAEVDQPALQRVLQPPHERLAPAAERHQARQVMPGVERVLPAGALVERAVVAPARVGGLLGGRPRDPRPERAVGAASAHEAGKAGGRVRQRGVPDVRPASAPPQQPFRRVGLAELRGDLRRAPVVVGERQRRAAGAEPPAVVVRDVGRHVAPLAVAGRPVVRVRRQHAPRPFPVDAGDALGRRVRDHVVHVVSALSRAHLLPLRERHLAPSAARQPAGERVHGTWGQTPTNAYILANLSSIELFHITDLPSFRLPPSHRASRSLREPREPPAVRRVADPAGAGRSPRPASTRPRPSARRCGTCRDGR